ncbi:translation initiation factor IF-3-like [Solanum tuberosum]|uniref:translation initiation factor IF-3-like n=1 Tax=Solanum tuberosum TaxID=4113 RepID=UPI00073A3C1F|nr:PREDICTED: translation initiation factor IF-3-like [Solanum tuberosum]
MDLKELKMGYNIDSHDYSVRLKAAQKFLKDGDKVKIIVNLKGRENEFRNNAIELLRRFQNDVGEVSMIFFLAQKVNISRDALCLQCPEDVNRFKSVNTKITTWSFNMKTYMRRYW